MLTFWETRRGMQLADTLIRELPKLTKKKEVVQYAATLKCEDVHEYICRKLETGSRFVGVDRKSTRLNSSHVSESRMPSSA